MTLLTPLALALSAVAVPVLLLYVLKLRRQERVVSSTLLWRRALEDVQANAPWQRLRPNLLLILQLLVLLAIVLALAGPAYSRSHAFAGDLVIVVDQSYGMQARDVRPSRFKVALDRAHSVATSVGSGNVVSVIGMGAQPHIAIAESADQGAIASAIDTLHVGVSPPNFLAALSLAASLARSGETTRVVVFTSRDSGIAGLPLSVQVPVDVVRIGGQLHDFGITAFQAGQSGKAAEAVVRVSNFGTRAARSDLNFYVDGQLADVRPLSLNAGSEQSLFWTNLPASAQRLEARLTVVDDVAADKTAWAVVPKPEVRRILFVSSGDYFLQTALTLDPAVQLTLIRPGAYASAQAQGFDGQVTVFDGWLPPVLPAGPVLVVAPTKGRSGQLRFGAPVVVDASPPRLTPAGTQSPIAQYVDLSDVHVAIARSTRLPGWLQPTVAGGNTTLIAAGDDGARRMVVFTFGPQQSDWPLRISFPVLVQNIVKYLAPGLTLGATNLIAGQPLKLSPPPSTSEIQITRPDQSIDTLHSPFAPYTQTLQLGIYGARSVGATGTTTIPFAVDFFPARSAAVPGPETLHFGHTQSGETRLVGVPVSVAWAFGLAALALLAVEWWFAFRR